MNSTPLVWSISCCRQVASRPVGLDLVRLAVEVEIFDAHRRRPLDFLVVFRDRQAAFLVGRLLVRFPDDFRIDEDLRRLRIVLLGEVHGDHALRHADLDGGKPDAGRRVHGLEHVVDQLAQRLVDRLHRLGFQPQPLVGDDEDVADRHARDVRARGGAVNALARFPLEPRAFSPYRSPFVRNGASNHGRSCACRKPSLSFSP